MAKDQKVTPTPAANTSNLVISQSPLFLETAAEYDSPRITKRLDEFIALKMANPMALFGTTKTDKPNTSGTPMSQEIPGIRHAHLTHDISVFYTLSGSNPRVLRLYAILSHDEAGMGQPPNTRIQKSMTKRMTNQRFPI